MSPSHRNEANRVRHFNRFYMRQLELLEETHLHSDLSLTEARVLYELAHHKTTTATEIRQALGLDAGYLSRLLKKFEKAGWLKKQESTLDARKFNLTLTPAGRAAHKPLNEAANRQVSAVLDALTDSEQSVLIDAMRTIEQLLAPNPSSSPGYTLRSLCTGDIGWVIHRQALLYEREYQWDITYEALVAGILADFVTHFDEQNENAWIAESGNQIVGSVFLKRVDNRTAKLRLLYVEPAYRGNGIARDLVAHCIQFASDSGFQQLTLWTNDVLTTARKLYEQAGFTLHAEASHESFGQTLTGQDWVLDL